MAGLDSLGGQFLQGLQGLGQTFSQLGNIVGQTISAGIGMLSTAFREGLGYVTESIYRFGEWMVNSVSYWGNAFLTGIGNLGNQFLAGLGSLGQQVLGGLEGLGQAVLGGLGQIGDILSMLPDLLGQLLTWLQENLLPMLQAGFMWLVNQLMTFVPQAVSWFTNAIAGIWQAISQFLHHAGEFLGWLGASLLDLIILRPIEALCNAVKQGGGGGGLISWLFSRGYTIGALLVDAVRAVLEVSKEELEREPLRNVYRFVNLVFTFNLLGGIAREIDKWISRLVQAKIMGSGLGDAGGGEGGEVSIIINAINWALGLGWLGWAALGPLVRATISDPMEQYYNIKYRPRAPSLSKLQDFVARGWIDPGLFAMELAKQGYDDLWIQLLYRDAFRPLTISQIEDLYEEGIFTIQDVYEKLQELGYDVPTAMLLTQLIHLRAIKDERSKLISRIAKWYARGLLERDKAAQYLKALGVPGFQADLILEAWELDYRLRVVDAKLDNLQDAYVKGLITLEELEREAAKLIRRPEMLEVYLEEAQIRRSPKITPLTYYRLETKLRRLETQATNLRSQIKYYEKRYDERRKYWWARLEIARTRYLRRIDSLRRRMQEEIDRVRKEYEFRIAVANAILQNYTLLSPEEISRVIEELRREAEVAPREKRRELMIMIGFLRAIRDLPPPAREDFLRRVIEDLSRRMEEEIAKIRARYEPRIESLQQEMNKYLQQLQAKAEEDLKKLAERLERLRRLLELTEEEIEALRRVIPA